MTNMRYVWLWLWQYWQYWNGVIQYLMFHMCGGMSPEHQHWPCGCGFVATHGSSVKFRADGNIFRVINASFQNIFMNYKSVLTHEGIVDDYIYSALKRHVTLDIGHLNVIIVFMAWQYTWKCDKTKTGPGCFDHVFSDMPMMFAVFSMSSESFKWWLDKLSDNRPNCLISLTNHSFRNHDF